MNFVIAITVYCIVAGLLLSIGVEAIEEIEDEETSDPD